MSHTLYHTCRSLLRCESSYWSRSKEGSWDKYCLSWQLFQGSHCYFLQQCKVNFFTGKWKRPNHCMWRGQSTGDKDATAIGKIESPLLLRLGRLPLLYQEDSSEIRGSVSLAPSGSSHTSSFQFMKSYFFPINALN